MLKCVYSKQIDFLSVKKIIIAKYLMAAIKDECQ